MFSKILIIIGAASYIVISIVIVRSIMNDHKYAEELCSSTIGAPQ